jgi:hypothetical protein
MCMHTCARVFVHLHKCVYMCMSAHAHMFICLSKRINLLNFSDRTLWCNCSKSHQYFMESPWSKLSYETGYLDCGEISGFHETGDQDNDILGCNAMWSGKSLPYSTLKMVAVCSSETLVTLVTINRTTCCHIPEDCCIYLHHILWILLSASRHVME